MARATQDARQQIPLFVQSLEVLKTMDIMTQRLNEDEYIVILFNAEIPERESIEHHFLSFREYYEPAFGVHFYKCIVDSNENNEFRKKFKIKVQNEEITRTIKATLITPTFMFFHHGKLIDQLEDEVTGKLNLPDRKDKLQRWLDMLIEDQSSSHQTQYMPTNAVFTTNDINPSTKTNGGESQMTAKVDWRPLMETGAEFIICDKNEQNIVNKLCKSLIEDKGKEFEARLPPDLLVTCTGGTKYFTMTDALEKEFMKGISQAAATKGVWLLTDGLNSGVTKFIAQSIYRYTLLNENAPKPTMIGMTGWKTVTEHTREVLKFYDELEFYNPGKQGNEKRLNYDEEKTLDQYHTKFMVFAGGNSDLPLPDQYRSKFIDGIHALTNCYAVTIVVEGSFSILEVIENDLKANRPVIIIHGSGRLANVLGTLLENTSPGSPITQEDIERELAKFPAIWPVSNHSAGDILRSIQEMLQQKYRDYLYLFKLEYDASLTDIICAAIFMSRKRSEEETRLEQTKKLLRLAVSWNHIDGAQVILKSIEKPETHYPELFEQALKENRPIFVDYFLRQYHNPLETTIFSKWKTIHASNNQIQPYDKEKFERNLESASAFEFIFGELYQSLEAPSHRGKLPNSIEQLDQAYRQLIGPYTNSLYSKPSTSDRLRQDLILLWKYTKSFFCCTDTIQMNKMSIKWNFTQPGPNNLGVYSIVLSQSPNIMTMSDPWEVSEQLGKDPKLWVQKNDHKMLMYDQQKMLRDIFLWSVYAGYSDIAIVLLLQLKSRMSAALIAAGIARRLSSSATSVDTRHRFNQQANDYETYATACITACYDQNKRLACQLLLREHILFGNITCMQTAIASRIMPFINTHCVNDVLEQYWFRQLFPSSGLDLGSTFKFILSLLSFGLLAPKLIEYHSDDTGDKSSRPTRQHVGTSITRSDRWKGIEDRPTKETAFWRKMQYFHSCPFVRMSYDFLLYIWFLLVFSYVVLFRMKSKDDPIHWTTIYIIIAVLAMLIENIRKVVVDYHTQMLEKWHWSDLWLVPMHAMPYILFGIGIILYAVSATRPSVFTAAKIIVAVDLELWYLMSLRFVSAVKLLGPKLFMIQNMIRDMAGILYIIFICVVAYGVVSRGLFMYDDLEFSVKSIFTNIFYRPYWYLYSIVDDEKKDLDSIISSNTSTSKQVAEATATHILLAFHMLLINLLILNLLIAMFSFSINAIQEKNEYYWRHQRYELICTYFHKPMLAFPPLTIITYFCWLIHKVCSTILLPTGHSEKHLCTTFELDTQWTDFENAATYEHARTTVEKNYRTRRKITIATLQEQVDTLSGYNAMMIQHMVNQMNEIKAIVDHRSYKTVDFEPYTSSLPPPSTYEYEASSDV